MGEKAEIQEWTFSLGFRCPKCGGRQKVKNTYLFPGRIKRRRVCIRCGYVRKTTEIADVELNDDNTIKIT